MIGQRFDRLLVEASGERRQGQRFWSCRCDCGRTHEATAYSLRTGRVKSCGCLNAELRQARNTKHGHALRGSKRRDPLYVVWHGMIRRCVDPKHLSWKYYGGRGITVCARWRRSFPAFLADMGRRPSPKHSIDRIDNGRGYAPRNCRWATASEQALNRRPKGST